MEDRVRVRVVVTRRTFAIVLLVSICCCCSGARIVVVMGVSVVAREYRDMLVQRFRRIHDVDVDGTCCRCAGPGDQRYKSNRKNFAKQTHTDRSTALGVASL